MQPKVSIVMPVYNAERYLEESVQHILDQTYTDFELIAVDDGSTDSSPEILSSFASRDSRVHVIHQENQGEGAARIAGFNACTGEWLASVDADDLVEPQLLEHLVKKGDDTGADIVIFRAETIDDKTEEVRPCDWTFLTDPNLGDVFSPEEMAPTLLDAFQNWVWNKLFRMEFLKTNNIHYLDVRRTADLYFTCTALVSAKRIALLDEVLYYYRINNSSSAMATSDSSPLDFYRAFCELKGYLEDHGLYETYKRTFRNWAAEGFKENLKVMRSFEGFSTLIDTFKSEGFSRLEIDLIKKEDALYEDTFEFCRFMIEHPLAECVFYVLGVFKEDLFGLRTFASFKRVETAQLKEYNDFLKERTEYLEGVKSDYYALAYSRKNLLKQIAKLTKESLPKGKKSGEKA